MTLWLGLIFSCFVPFFAVFFDLALHYFPLRLHASRFVARRDSSKQLRLSHRVLLAVAATTLSPHVEKRARQELTAMNIMVRCAGQTQSSPTGGFFSTE